jgi:CDP-paratose 2-epimerase
VRAFWHFFEAPRSGEAYNLGGGRYANCSILEAIAIVERLVGKPLNWSYSESSRTGDHIWWISDTRKFEAHYPDWRLSYTTERLIEEIHCGLAERQAAEVY